MVSVLRKRLFGLKFLTKVLQHYPVLKIHVDNYFPLLDVPTFITLRIFQNQNKRYRFDPSRILAKLTNINRFYISKSIDQ